jgi:hypothetical protein
MASKSFIFLAMHSVCVGFAMCTKMRFCAINVRLSAPKRLKSGVLMSKSVVEENAFCEKWAKS